MLAVWILLGLLLLIALLLSLSLTFVIRLTDHAELSVGIAFYRYPILPPKEEKAPSERKKKKLLKKEAKKQQEELQKKKEAAAQKKPDEKSLGEMLELISAILRSVLPDTGRMLSHLRITGLRMFIRVGCEDADDTAIRYGQINAAVYTLLGAIDSLITLRVKSVDILPDFVRGESEYQISCKVKLRLCHIVGGGLKIGFQLLRNLFRLKKDTPGESPLPKDAAPNKEIIN